MNDKTLTKESPQAKFWNWFSQNEEAYFNFETNQEELCTKILRYLKRINETLTFEFSPIFKSGRRELVISANGLIEGFPAVKKLVNAAPHFERWDIIAFRQPRPELTAIKLENFNLNFEQVCFRHHKEDEKIGLEIFLQNFEDSELELMAVLLMLDSVIGEYETEMMIGTIETKKYPEEHSDELLPIKHLPLVLELHKVELLKSDF